MKVTIGQIYRDTFWDTEARKDAKEYEACEIDGDNHILFRFKDWSGRIRHTSIANDYFETYFELVGQKRKRIG